MSELILIVEDEPELATVLRDYFSADGFQCSVLNNGSEVTDFVAKHPPQLVILDIQLPGKNGLDICRELRVSSNIPIIMTTARVDEIDRLIGLELGADDYICKPYSPREVVARAKAVLRRAVPKVNDKQDEINLGRLHIEIARRMAYVDRQAITLTPVEFDLLLLFAQRPREVLSRAALLKCAKGSAFEGYERNMDTHVKNLRKKLKRQLNNIDPFRSVYGVGYALNSETLM